MACIRNLSQHFREMCEQRGVTYGASLTTNGYLLNKETVNALHDLAISGVQVTLDGPADLHNARRRLRDGRGTFSTIVRNLEYLITTYHNIAVWIRVNCDPCNVSEVSGIFDALSKVIRERTDIYLATVYSCESFVGFQPKAGGQFPLSMEQQTSESFRAQLRDLQLRSVTERSIGNPNPVTRFVLRPRWAYCEADYANRFVVDPEGNLHKCTVSSATENRVGYLTADGGVMLDLGKLSPWLSKDPFSRRKCLSCKVLPLCMGGCRSAYLQTASEEFCATLLSEDEVQKHLGTLHAFAKNLVLNESHDHRCFSASSQSALIPRSVRFP